MYIRLAFVFSIGSAVGLYWEIWDAPGPEMGPETCRGNSLSCTSIGLGSNWFRCAVPHFRSHFPGTERGRQVRACRTPLHKPWTCDIWATVPAHVTSRRETTSTQLSRVLRRLSVSANKSKSADRGTLRWPRVACPGASFRVTWLSFALHDSLQHFSERNPVGGKFSNLLYVSGRLYFALIISEGYFG